MYRGVASGEWCLLWCWGPVLVLSAGAGRLQFIEANQRARGITYDVVYALPRDGKMQKEQELMSICNVRFMPFDKAVDVQPETSLLEAAAEAGIIMN